jgi:hypothetical protein
LCLKGVLRRVLVSRGLTGVANWLILRGTSGFCLKEELLLLSCMLGESGRVKSVVSSVGISEVSWELLDGSSMLRLGADRRLGVPTNKADRPYSILR